MSSRGTRSGTKNVLTKTLTYFIPAPPQRKSGYREVEFDKIMQGFLTSGFQLLQLQTQAVESGLFVIATIKAGNKKIFALDEKLDFHEQFRLSHSHSSPDILLDDEDDA